MARTRKQTEAPAVPEPVQQEQVTLRGRLCADPQLRHTANGKAVSTIRIAVHDGDSTTFHSVVVWGRTAEVVCEFLNKGRLVEVTGRLHKRTYQAGDGSERTVDEIIAWRVQFIGREQLAAAAAEQGVVA